MQSMRKVILFIFTLILVSSCVKYYKYTNRFRKITEKNYSLTDTIYVKDFILCNNSRDMNKLLNPIGDVVPINEDSVLSIFKNAVSKLGASIEFIPMGENHCDYDFHRNHHLSFRKMNIEKIMKIGNNLSGKTVLLPVIYIENLYENQIYFLSSGVPAGGDLIRNSYLKIAMFILQDEEVIYFRSAKHGTISSHEDFEEEPKRQTQENWDKLVKMVMSDYIERLK